MGRQMSERAEFHVMGQPFDGAPLHYTASGLDYVYLVNGFSITDDPEHGRTTKIKNERDLHHAIGMHIIMKSGILKAAEFRFLRKLMKYTQKELADELGVDEQTVANYEKNKTIPKSSDRAIRTTFLLWITPDDVRADVIKRMQEAVKTRRNKGQKSSVNADIPTFTKQWQNSEVHCQ
jgi:putative transcriptional regulator